MACLFAQSFLLKWLPTINFKFEEIQLVCHKSSKVCAPHPKNRIFRIYPRFSIRENHFVSETDRKTHALSQCVLPCSTQICCLD